MPEVTLQYHGCSLRSLLALARFAMRILRAKTQRTAKNAKSNPPVIQKQGRVVGDRAA